MKSNITELKLDDMQNVTGGALYAQNQAYGSTTMPRPCAMTRETSTRSRPRNTVCSRCSRPTRSGCCPATGCWN